MDETRSTTGGEGGGWIIQFPQPDLPDGGDRTSRQARRTGVSQDTRADVSLALLTRYPCMLHPKLRATRRSLNYNPPPFEDDNQIVIELFVYISKAVDVSMLVEK